MSIPSLFPDFKTFYQNHSKIRVNGVSLDTFNVKCQPGFTGPVRLELDFGTEFVLRGAQGTTISFVSPRARRPSATAST